MIPQKHLCQSCHCTIEANENFCSICGQKKIIGSTSIWELTSDFFANILTLDSKFVRTFSTLFFVPGKLTSEYLAGKRNLYYAPIRMFLFWMTILFILFNLISSKRIDTSRDMDRNLNVYLQIHQDSLHQKLIHIFRDSTDQQKITDVFEVQKQKIYTDREKWVSIGFDEDGLSISYDDLMTMEPEAIIEKYEIKSYRRQILIMQVVKLYKNQQSFQIYLLSHLSWMVLFSVPMLAFFFKLLYYNQKRLYVDHLVYIFNLHTFFFVIGSLLLGYTLLTGGSYNSTSTSLITLLIFIIYLFISIKKVYGQSVLKTGLKTFMFFIAYFIIVSIAFAMFVVLSFFLF